MDAVSMVIGAAGLVALVTTVEDFFQKVSTWQHLGADYEHYSLQLRLANIAFQRWKNSVKLVDDATTLDTARLPVASPDEARTVVDLLGAIKLAFENAKKTSRKFENEDTSRTEPPPHSFEARVQAAVKAREGASSHELGSNGRSQPLDSTLESKARAAENSRQSSASFLTKARWVVHDKKAIAELVKRIDTNVNKLVTLFPAATQKLQERLAALDIANIVSAEAPEKREDLVKLQSVNVGLDPIMQQAATDEVKRIDQRHVYLRTNVLDEANVVLGDELAHGASVTRPGHSYTDITASGHSNVLMGDRVGMPSLFSPTPSNSESGTESG